MRDHDMRAALVAQVLSAHRENPDTLVRHELGICAGRRRVDVAVVNGEICGWEIKSDEDTLVRLGGQVEAYGLVLDRATLVTTPRWETKAGALVPAWWGITLISDEGGEVTVEPRRSAGLNEDGVDGFSLAQLLWRDEAMGELRRLGAAKGLSSKARHYVWERLAESTDLETLKGLVRARLKGRPDWQGGL